MTQKLRVVLATDDKQTLTSDHFGEARVFLFYEISPESITFLKEITNSSDEEKEHGDAQKAAQIQQLIKDAEVMVGRAMGKNILRMKARFLPVISRYPSIEETLQAIQQQFSQLVTELQQPERKTFILDPRRS